MQILDLSLKLLAHILRLCPQGVRHAARAVLDPAFDLGRRQVELAAGSGHRRLALDHLEGQHRLAQGGPALEVFLHHLAKRCCSRSS